jgi:HPt (histidine-containing phosphotransfer) domain-containing protein
MTSPPAGADVAGNPSDVAWIQESFEHDVGPALYQELRVEFLEQLSPQLLHLAGAAASGDVNAARVVAHQLRGTAPCFGAAHLDRLAEQLLTMNGHGRHRLRGLVHEIRKEVERLQAGQSG